MDFVVGGVTCRVAARSNDASSIPKTTESLGCLHLQLSSNSRFWPILLKKTVPSRFACTDARKQPIDALLHEI
ncbi:hypothetical protein [Pseudomonas sp. FME51]|uniref:hypothetical protein n=1 Tax=Pseudomonas sp. FME51 TaxID=2742609 RepID=UPI0018666EA7|nr:hypothetical protein [Pseudomonas sp. FME51]